MALATLSGDEQRIIFSKLYNVLDPGVAVGFSAVSSGLWELMQALRKQLRADHEAAAALCRKLGMQSCKELREAKKLNFGVRDDKGLSAADLGLLGTLGSVLPALEELCLFDSSGSAAGHDGVQRLVEGLGAGALPGLNTFALGKMHTGDAGASALAGALGRGALPRLKILGLYRAAITDAGLVALAPALRRLPTLEELTLSNNPLGDEGIAALVAPLPAGALPPPTGALPPPTGGLKKLTALDLWGTHITDAGCATLTSALDSGALPALERLRWDSAFSCATHTAIAAVRVALAKDRQ